MSQVMLETLDEPVDAVITTSAGYPLDLTFYQAIKGVTAASHIVKPGGRILLVAACEEGAGAPEFRRMLLESPSDAEFLKQIEGAPVTVDQWQLEKLALVTDAAAAAVLRPRAAGGISRESVGRGVRNVGCGDGGVDRGSAGECEHRGDSGRSVRSGEGARIRHGCGLAELRSKPRRPICLQAARPRPARKAAARSDCHLPTPPETGTARAAAGCESRRRCRPPAQARRVSTTAIYGSGKGCQILSGAVQNRDGHFIALLSRACPPSRPIVATRWRGQSGV